MNNVPYSTINPDRYKTYAELEHALVEAGISSIQMVFGLDFSKSNEWSGQ